MTEILHQEKPKRRAMSKKLRFEVFKRDSFKCQYCGKSAPDVVLHVDHIHPVSKGGKNEIMNLITACCDCNGGKSDRLLTDDSAMAKQRAQLEELNDRREQLKQMLDWREGLRGIENDTFEAINQSWMRAAPGWHINEAGKAVFRKLISKFGLAEVLESVEISAQYIQLDDEGKATHETAMKAMDKIGGICRTRSAPDWKRELYYVRGILRNRLTYINMHLCLQLLEQAYEVGVDLDVLKQCAKDVRNWTEFRAAMDAMIEGEE